MSSIPPNLSCGDFVKLINDPNKVVLALFYASWCPHCHKLMPDWEKLMMEHSKAENYTIARIDADKCKEIGDRYHIETFPTIKMFTKTNKEGILFKGTRTLPALNKFLKRHIK